MNLAANALGLGAFGGARLRWGSARSVGPSHPLCPLRLRWDSARSVGPSPLLRRVSLRQPLDTSDSAFTLHLPVRHPIALPLGSVKTLRARRMDRVSDDDLGCVGVVSERGHARPRLRENEPVSVVMNRDRL